MAHHPRASTDPDIKEQGAAVGQGHRGDGEFRDGVEVKKRLWKGGEKGAWRRRADLFCSRDSRWRCDWRHNQSKSSNQIILIRYWRTRARSLLFFFKCLVSVLVDFHCRFGVWHQTKLAVSCSETSIIPTEDRTASLFDCAAFFLLAYSSVVHVQWILSNVFVTRSGFPDAVLVEHKVLASNNNDDDNNFYDL